MLFSSEEFLFYFLPIFLVIYYLVPARFRNAVLVLGSLYFYYTGEKRWFWVILFSICLNFVFTGIMCKRGQKRRKLWLGIILCIDFGMLIAFKYFLGPPLGVSFYTFQIAAYAIDVYKKPATYESNLIDFATYVCMFPQLIAGPIVLYSDVSKKLKKRRIGAEQLERGFMLFTVGLGYKILLANTIGNLWTEIQITGIESISVPMAWLGAIAFGFQLYFDFQGYSLMAMGLGEMLGFKLPRNFKDPYTAVSVTDFWRRWHITLSSWFRNYVYIPLGGNRKGVLRTMLNLFIVWSLTGIWHGNSWNFLMWGVYYFVWLILEKFVLRTFFEKHHGIGRVYTWLVVFSGWVIFALDEWKHIPIYFEKMYLNLIDAGAWSMNFHVTASALYRYGFLFVIAAICSTPLPERIYRKCKDKLWLKLVLLVLFWGSFYRVITAVNNPFLYFRF